MQDLDRQVARVALAQYGYVSAEQVYALGLDTNAIGGHLRDHTWNRVGRNIFRLSQWPTGMIDPFDQIVRWCVQLGAVVSHGSAAQTYPELRGTFEPVYVHLTAPVRPVWTPTPELAVHVAPLPPSDIDHHAVFPRTTAVRTARDVGSSR